MARKLRAQGIDQWDDLQIERQIERQRGALQSLQHVDQHPAVRIEPGTLSKIIAGGVAMRSRIISVSAPSSKSQWAPEIGFQLLKPFDLFEPIAQIDIAVGVVFVWY